MSVVEDLARRWNRFWFEPTFTHSLGIVRIYTGTALVLYLTGLWGLYRLDDLQARLPRSDVFHLKELAGTPRLPYPGLGWLPVPGEAAYDLLQMLLLILAVMMLVGLGTRVVVPATALLFGYLFLTNQWSYHHHSFLMLIVLAILSFSRCGEHHSLDARLRDRPAIERASPLPLRLLQTLIPLIYVFTFLSKANGAWWSGLTIELFDSDGRLEGPVAGAAVDLVGYRLMGAATVAAEGFLAVGLWFRETRRAAIAVGVALHLGIDAMMDVGTFSYQMLALYTVYVAPASRSTVVVHDDRSPAVRRWRRALSSLDWLYRFTWLDLHGSEVVEGLPRGLKRTGERDVIVVTPAGEVMTGFRAWRHLLNTVPLTFLPSYLLYLPGARDLAARLYERAVVRRRTDRGAPPPATSEVWEETLERASASGP